MRVFSKTESAARPLGWSFPAFVFFMLLSTGALSAEVVTFEEEYSYKTTELDSKLSCRVIALNHTKRLLMDKLAAHLDAATVKSLKLTRSEIAVLLPGVVESEVTEEKWDNRTCLLKARVSADPDIVVRALDSLRKNGNKTKTLKEAKARSDNHLKEIDRIRKELETAKADNGTALRAGGKASEQYTKAVKALSTAESMARGRALHTAGRYKEAVTVYTKILEYDPENSEALAKRGTAYLRTNDLRHAISDFGTAIKLDPKKTNLYNYRGIAYKRSGSSAEAVSDFNRAVELDTKYDEAYNNRGMVHADANNLEQAIDDYSTAIRLNQKNADAYNNRGAAYAKMGRIDLAIEDFNNAIKHNPKLADAYSNRGFAYAEAGSLKLAVKDLNSAARLGNRRAAEFLRSQKIAR